MMGDLFRAETVLNHAVDAGDMGVRVLQREA